MGSVRSKSIKRAAHEFIEKYPGQFSRDFTENTKVLNGIIKMESKTTRNRVARYITTILGHPEE